MLHREPRALDLEAAPGRVLLARSSALPDNRHFFAALKDIPFRPAIDVEVEVVGNEITVSADHYTYGVGLYADDPTARFSDNFFDLVAGESRTVSVTGTDLASVDIRSIFESRTA